MTIVTFSTLCHSRRGLPIGEGLVLRSNPSPSFSTLCSFKDSPACPRLPWLQLASLFFLLRRQELPLSPSTSSVPPINSSPLSAATALSLLMNCSKFHTDSLPLFGSHPPSPQFPFATRHCFRGSIVVSLTAAPFPAIFYKNLPRYSVLRSPRFFAPSATPVPVNLYLSFSSFNLLIVQPPWSFISVQPVTPVRTVGLAISPFKSPCFLAPTPDY